MTPNQITLLRVGVAFLAVAVLGRATGTGGPLTGFVAVGLIVVAIALDAVDGYVARRRRLATPLGAEFDILGDRVVENLFFTFFAVSGLVSFWVPVVFFFRGVSTDFLRHNAGGCRQAGSPTPLLQTEWARLLVSARWSRAAYGTLKCVCFCWLALEIVLPGAKAAAQWLVASAVAFCLLRGLPILWEARRYLYLDSPPLRSANPHRGDKLDSYVAGAATR